MDFPSYIQRFTKIGTALRMWFKPLQDVMGEVVNYEQDEKEEQQYPF